VFSADGAFKRKFATNGAGNGQLNFPIGVVMSVAGDVFVLEPATVCSSSASTVRSSAW
jgi:hypothetical protein